MKARILKRGDALLLVDVQNDFLPDGALAVKDGDQIIPFLNQYIEQFERQQLAIFASRDWHPADHCSFSKQGGNWPEHCIQHTPGAAFAANLTLPRDAHIINKAQNRDQDAYSAFENTALHEQLEKLDIKRVFIGGLATDYCVLNTVLDALKLGYQVLVLEDAIRPVNLQPEDGNQAKLKMQQAGAVMINIADIEAR